MRFTLSRRLATPVLAAAAAIGLAIGAVGGTALADPGQTSNTGSSDKLTYTRSVVGPATINPGGKVSYKTVLSHTGGTPEKWITQIYDHPPAGFTLDSATVTYTSRTDRASVAQQGDGSVLIKCTGGCSTLGGGFVLKSGQPVTVETTYRSLATTPFGVYDSGFRYCAYNISFGCDWFGSNPFNVNIEVADPAVATTTDLQAPATAKTGEAVTLTANVGPANSVGTVQFKDGAGNIGSPVTVSGGVATLSHTFDTVGAHSISAVFTAGAGFHNSTSGAKTVDVTADTTTTLAAPATATVGEDVTFTATVAPAGAAGQVQFKDGAADLGAPVAVVNGQATLTRTFAEAGSHNVTANFVGTAGYANSVSAASSLTVTDADFGTTTTVLEPVTAVVGTPVNLSATVFPIPSGGNVTFTVDGTPVGTAQVGTADGVAVLLHTFDTAGSANVVAEFTGTAGFTPSTSAGFTVAVSNPDTRVATTTALAVAGNAAVGQAVTLTATVDPANADGTVQFKAGTTAIGSPVAVVNGVATLTHTFDAEGTYAVTAGFVGGSGFKDSVSGPTVLTVAGASNPGTGGTGSLDFGS